MKRLKGLKDNKVYLGPEVVSLEVTNSCTLRCKYCTANHAPGNPDHFQDAAFLPWEKFVCYVQDCIDLKVDQINIVGAGEPALHPQFREMLRHVEHKPLRVYMTTNATFPVEYCPDVIKADHVLINLGAVEREQYRKIHENDLFDLVIANIKRLASLRDKYKPDFVMDVAYIVNSLNVDQKKAMREMAGEIGINTIEFIRMHENIYNKEIALPTTSGEAEVQRTPEPCVNGWFYMVATLGDCFGTCYKIPPAIHFSGDHALLKAWFSPAMMKARLLGKSNRTQTEHLPCKTCVFYENNMAVLRKKRYWKVPATLKPR